MTARVRRPIHRSLFFAAVSSSAACNLITGAHERFLDESGDETIPGSEGGADVRTDRSSSDGAPLSPVDAGNGDTGVVVRTVDVRGTWSSPNGATWLVTDGGVTITGYDAAANHPVIYPVPQPSIPAEDYTVRATVRAPKNAEFGIVARVQPDGSGIVFGSTYAGINRSFLGSLSSTDWNPLLGAQGPTYSYVANARYMFEVKFVSNEASAKFWESTQPEPQSTQIVWTGPLKTGRGVGFYHYFAQGVGPEAVLESLTVTVP